MSKRLLLTGAGGFMGSHILRHVLSKTDWHVVCLDSFRHKGLTDRIVQQAEGYDTDRFTVLAHDLNAPISPLLARKIGSIDYLINTASESHVDRSITDPRDFIENNVSLMLTMLEYAREYPIEKFIQISTDEVYGPAPRGHDFAEGEPHRPSNPYSASKAAQESICFAYWRTYGLPIIITNTMNIIGETQDPEKYIPMVMQRIARGEAVTIHGSTDGKEIGARHYLHARNQADALLFILQTIPVALYGEIDVREPATFNIVGEKETNNLKLAQMIADYMGKELQYKIVDFHSSRPGHDLRYALDGSKLKALGWTAPLTLEESLKQTINWTLAHPEWLHL